MTPLCKNCKLLPVYADIKLCERCYAKELLTPRRKNMVSKTRSRLFINKWWYGIVISMDEICEKCGGETQNGICINCDLWKLWAKSRIWQELAGIIATAVELSISAVFLILIFMRERSAPVAGERRMAGIGWARYDAYVRCVWWEVGNALDYSCGDGGSGRGVSYFGMVAREGEEKVIENIVKMIVQKADAVEIHFFTGEPLVITEEKNGVGQSLIMVRCGNELVFYRRVDPKWG